MPMTTRATLIETEELTGPLNMALDELLWEASAQGVPFFRMYGWSDRPALSLGYFQSYVKARSVPGWATAPLVRRMTGGGAIVHDQDLTYALTLPARLASRS